jgi:transposase-like protein
MSPFSSLRPESSVSVNLDEFGQVVFAADRNGAVIHRTPEELGLPRVVAAAPPPAKREERTPAEVEHLRRQLRKAPLRVIHGEPVRVAPMAQMGAEMLNEVGGTVMATAAEIKALVMAEPMDSPVADVMAKCGASQQQVYQWRYEARKKAGLVPQKKSSPKKAKPAKVKSAGMQRVDVDPQRPGTASALLGALAKQDAAAERIKLELDVSLAEVAHIIGRLDVVQRQAFFAAGIRAALLAH